MKNQKFSYDLGYGLFLYFSSCLKTICTLVKVIHKNLLMVKEAFYQFETHGRRYYYDASKKGFHYI